MRSESILVADDDRALLRVLELHFQHERYTVHTADDGATALAALREHRPSLVILDVMMPAMTGIEVCHAIRTDPTLASTTVLVLTARESAEEPALAAGADAFVTKPYNLAQLSARVREMVDRMPARA